MTTEKYFKIEGIVCDENQQGLAGLIVEALDKDFLCDDRLGSTRTDDNGRFEIAYSKADFSMFFEQKPDIYLRVKEADGTVIHTTENKVRYEAGRTEEFRIGISSAHLRRTDIPQSSQFYQLSAESIQELLKELRTKPPWWPPGDPGPDWGFRDQLHRFLESDKELTHRLLQLEVEFKLKEMRIQQEMLNGVSEIIKK